MPSPEQAAAAQTPEIGEAASEDIIVSGVSGSLQRATARAVFTTVSPNVALHDFPAGPLARIGVVKSQTAELIEGDSAGTISPQLNKLFAFREPAVALSARQSRSAGQGSARGAACLYE